jgi:hypothetical protein
MRWLAYLHPALMIVVLTLGLVVLREGLRIRRARFFRHEIDSSLHRRLGRIFVALIVLGFGAGLVSMGWLRQKALFESVHSRLVTGVLVGLLLAAAFGLWLERSEDDRVRGIHLSFAAGGLLLALTAAVAGFAILP